MSKAIMKILDIEHFINLINIRKSTGWKVGLFVVQKNKPPITYL